VVDARQLELLASGRCRVSAFILACGTTQFLMSGHCGTRITQYKASSKQDTAALSAQGSACSRIRFPIGLPRKNDIPCAWVATGLSVVGLKSLKRSNTLNSTL